MNGKYNVYPTIDCKDLDILCKWEDVATLARKNNTHVIVIETYPGVDLASLKEVILDKIKPDKLIWSEDFALQGNDFRSAILEDLTNDRVFGHFTKHSYKDFFDFDKINNLMKNLDNSKLTIIYGTGASYFANKALKIYVDITRWEIQCRYRHNQRVFFGGTLEDETIKNFKRGYFVEWIMADKIKFDYLNSTSFYVDGTTNDFKLIRTKNLMKLLSIVSKRPFRLVPYFDVGVWGGTWMEKHLNLGKSKNGNWAWGFDGVPEENSLLFDLTNGQFAIPALNLVHFEALNLLGQKVYKRFGKEFPIRFDFLDTVNGSNLSLQVHPTVEYMKKTFGLDYTQEESYYILDTDTKSKPKVYLGLKNQVRKKDLFDALAKANDTQAFNVEDYVNVYEVKKHDHYLHPGGVIHASGAGAMVLEISSTPYIFTFKLWDWARLDLNGKPRPINLKHGFAVLDESFDTDRTTKELVNQFEVVNSTDEYIEEKTGLHAKQFIETRRFTIYPNKSVIIKNHDSVNMLNLIEGQSIIVFDPNDKFKPLIVNYAETFIVPKSCRKYHIKSLNPDQEVKILQAYVR